MGQRATGTEWLLGASGSADATKSAGSQAQELFLTRGIVYSAPPLHCGARERVACSPHIALSSSPKLPSPLWAVKLRGASGTDQASAAQHNPTGRGAAKTAPRPLA